MADYIIAIPYIVIIRSDPSITSCLLRRAGHGVQPLVSLGNTEEDVADQNQPRITDI